MSRTAQGLLSPPRRRTRPRRVLPGLAFGLGLGLAGMALPVRAEDGELSSWGSLPPGPYLVGHRAEVLLDPARRYLTSFDQGATYGGDRKRPRPVLVNLWYPARREGAAPAMAYGGYFEPTVPDASLEPWARALAAYAADVSATELAGVPVAELDEAERGAWERFLALPTRAHPEAEPLPGPFPFVVYHSGAGSSFEDNTPFLEYLASHGYVVLGSAYQAADGSGFGIDSMDGSVRDMEFLARHAAGLPFVDWTRGAFGGHSAGAQVSMRAQLRPDCPADALFLFDTTADYYGLSIPNFRYLTEPVLEDPTAFVRPMLVTAGHEASFQMCDRLTSSDRTYLTLPELGHNEFIAQGVLRLTVLEWLGEQHADEVARRHQVERLFVELCVATRLFLDAELGGRREPFEALCRSLQDNPLGGDRPCVERAPPGASGPPPFDPEGGRAPTPRQLMPLLEAAGMEGVLEALQAHVDDVPRAPVYWSGMVMGSLLHDLADRGRLDEARALHAWLEGIGEDALGTFRFLAFMNTLAGRRDRARALLEVALTIDPDDSRTREELGELDEEG